MGLFRETTSLGWMVLGSGRNRFGEKRVEELGGSKDSIMGGEDMELAEEDDDVEMEDVDEELKGWEEPEKGE
jgi:hypothetical protein